MIYFKLKMSFCGHDFIFFSFYHILPLVKNAMRHQKFLKISASHCLDFFSFLIQIFCFVLIISSCCQIIEILWRRHSNIYSHGMYVSACTIFYNRKWPKHLTVHVLFIYSKYRYFFFNSLSIPFTLFVHLNGNLF
jgi:hypothetical protein